MLRKRLNGQKKFSLASFYWKRFLRLTPALAFMVSVVLAISVFVLSPFGAQQIAAKTGAMAILLGANLLIASTSGNYFAEEAMRNLFLHTWSLSVEEQFYLVFPLSMIVIWRIFKKSSRKVLWSLVVFSALAIASWLLIFLSEGIETTKGFGLLVGYYGPATRVWEFCAGIVIALGADFLTSKTRRISLAFSTTGFMLLVASLWIVTPEHTYPGTATLYPVLGTCLLLAGGLNQNAVSKVLSLRSLAAIGDRSYSLYLWHWPLIILANLLWPAWDFAALMGLVMSVPYALFAYRYVETKFRYHTQTDFQSAVPKRLGFAITVVTLPLFFSSLLFTGAQLKWGVSWKEQIAFPPAYTGKSAIECQRDEYTPDPEVSCWQPKADWNGKTILVLGDSQAAMIWPAVVEAGSNLGYRSFVSFKPGCPIIAQNENQHLGTSCQIWQSKALGLSNLYNADIVLLANRAFPFLTPSGKAKSQVENAGLVFGSAENMFQNYLKRTERSVLDFQSLGAKVILAGPLPEPPIVDNRASILRKFLPAFGPEYFKLDDISGDQARVANFYQQVSAQVPNLYIYDYVQTLCPQRRCEILRSGESLYFDRTHLSNFGVSLLEESVHRVLIDSSK